MSTKSATRPGVLNARQLKFVDEYLVDLNATQAAIRAGYSKKTAGQIGFNLLKNVEVAAAIEAKRKEVAHTVGITRERILKEMAALAFSDVRKLFNAEGGMLHPSAWPDGVAAAVSSIEVTSFTPPGDDAVPEYTKKVKLWDKGKQLEALLKHLGMDADQPAAPVVYAVTADALAALEAKAAKIKATS